MKKLLLIPLLLLFSGSATGQLLSNEAPAHAYTEVDSGQTTGYVFAFMHFTRGTQALGLVPPISFAMVPHTDVPGTSIGVGGSTVASEWMSGGIKRTVTTKVTGGRGSQRLAVQRHNQLVIESLRYWPKDP